MASLMRKKHATDAFFALVQSGLWETDAQMASFGKIDFGEILRIAKEQLVVGLVAAGVEHIIDVKVPQVSALNVAGEVLQIEQRNKAMNLFVASVIEKMRAAGIYTLLVKGQGVAQSYKRPLWRACGDVDFFLSDEDYEKAKNFLVPYASEVEIEFKGSKHLGLTIDGWEVELHGSLRVGMPSKINRVLDDIKADTFRSGNVRSWMNGQTQVFMLGRENDVVYVFVHFFNHFYKGGIGLRQICDWCRLLYTFRDSLNLELLESRIKEMGLIGEWKAFGAFAVEYLGMPIDAMPLLETNDGIDANLKRKAELIKDFVMEVGNFGHNRDNSYFQKQSYFVQKCISAWRRVKDLCRHARIFPANSLRFFFGIMWNGVVSAARGE